MLFIREAMITKINKLITKKRLYFFTIEYKILKYYFNLRLSLTLRKAFMLRMCAELNAASVFKILYFLLVRSRLNLTVAWNSNYVLRINRIVTVKRILYTQNEHFSWNKINQ